MKLSIPFFQKKEESGKYFLALQFSPEDMSIIILEESAGNLIIVSKQDQLITGNIDDLTIDELIEAIDRAVSRAIEILPADIEIKKTVFAVKESWVEPESKKIKKIYLQKLKKVCDTLELSPIGFIVLTEAISDLMQKVEGAPLSAILTDLNKKTVTLTLLRGGKSIQIVEGPLEGDYTSTVDNLLKRFTIEVLPARIILHDSEISRGLVQKFTGHQWSKSLPFLHMPQISILPEGFESRAITAGAAGQMSLEVINDDKNPIKTFQSKLSDDTEEESTEIAEPKKHDHPAEKPEQLIQEENFGFVIGHDIAGIKQSHNHFKTQEKVISQADQAVNNANEIDEVIDDDPEEVEIVEGDDDSVEEKGKAFKKVSFPKITIIKINSFWIKGIILPLIIIGILAGGAYYLYFNKVKASIIVTLTPKTESQSIDVVFTAESANDFDNNVIAAKQIDGTLSGDMTIGASGKKDVGDKAHGEVTIYNNNTDSDESLTAGATIKSSNGLEFILDKEVKISSASGDVFSGTKPGTANVKVTAGDIGTNYNLPSDTKFSVGGNNSLAAKNDNAFSGGTKKSVTVVSKDDLVKLKTELIKSLENKVSNELLKQNQSEDTILPVVLSTSIEKDKYDKNAGDEAKTVKLTATINFTGLSFQNTDQKSFVMTLLNKKYSDEMTFDENSIDVEIKDPKKESDKEISATLNLNTSLLPKIETQELSKKLSGKPANEANSIISRLPQVKEMAINYNPNIYFLSKLFPRLPNNVTVTLSSN